MSSQLTLSNREDVAWYLASLGMLISSKVKKKRDYIDIEKFFILSTNYVYDDLRLSRSMEYWCLAYGKYLSFKKLNKILSKMDSDLYDSSVLGALLAIADPHFPEKGKFKGLSKYCETKAEEKRLSKLFSNKKKCDPRWARFGIIAPEFIANEISNNLCCKSHLKKHVPEMYYRMLGFSSSISDLKAIIAFNENISIYKMAKITGLTYATVFNLIKDFELYDFKDSTKEYVI
ncbi:MAG: hypothetical protein GY909_15340 [Oligoflexia bacterium]|nr:hypothetical protein [Oligoflexia bacterium]